MTWVKLDDKFWANPKVQAVGNEAAGAFARMLSFCGDHLTDGKIPEPTAQFIAGPETLDVLEGHGFIERNGSGYIVPEFLDFNPTRDEVAAMRKARAEAGRRGGKKSRPRKSEAA